MATIGMDTEDSVIIHGIILTAHLIMDSLAEDITITTETYTLITITLQIIQMEQVMVHEETVL